MEKPSYVKGDKVDELPLGVLRPTGIPQAPPIAEAPTIRKAVPEVLPV